MLPAQRFLVVAATLMATWAVARFLAVGVGRRFREADLDRQPPPSDADIRAWRRALRRELHERWAGPLSPLAAVSAGPVARLVGPRPAIGQESGLHLVVGATGVGTSVVLWGTHASLLADPDGPTPLLLDATRMPVPPQPLQTDPFHRLVVGELTNLTGMPVGVAERLAPEVVLLIDGFDGLLASAPDAAVDLLQALGGRPPATGGLHTVVALARQRHEDPPPARRIMVSTTPAGYGAFVRAGLTEPDGPLVTVTHLEPVVEATVRATIDDLDPPCPALATAADRLAALIPLLGYPLWLDVALEAFAGPAGDDGGRSVDDTDPLAHLPATAGTAEIGAALWDRWLERRLGPDPDSRRFASLLARRRPPRTQPTFGLHDLGRAGAGAHAWFEGMAVGTGATILASGLPAATGGGWRSVVVGLVSAVSAGTAFSLLLRRHERRATRVGPGPEGEGADDAEDIPALAGLATGAIVMIVTAGPALLAGGDALAVMLLWPLLIAVPVGMAGWLAFRARFGIGRPGSALLALGAFGGTLSVLCMGAPTSLYLGGFMYPLPGDPADLLGWWTAALIVGPVVGVVDGIGLAGPGPVRFRSDRALRALGRSAPSAVGLPLIGSVLVSGALLLGVLVQPPLVALLVPFAIGGAVIGLAAWLVGAVGAGFVPDPERRPSSGPGAAAGADVRRAMVRSLVAVATTVVVAVPTGWVAGRWLSELQLGPWSGLSGLVREDVPMVPSVLTGVALTIWLWLVATVATVAPLRQRLVLAIAASRGRAPRNYPAFLDELVAAGVLHRCGAGFRFRHPTLADHLAGHPVDEPVDQPAPPVAPNDAFDPAPPPVAV